MTYYDRQLDCPSNSTLKHFRVSPYAYWYHVTQGDKRDTASMSLGRIVHMALLEPALFASSVLVMPAMEMRGTAAKAAYIDTALTMAQVTADIDATQKAPAVREAVAAALLWAGKVLVSHDEMETLKAQIASLNRPQHRLARQALTMHELTEVEVYWVDEESGVSCKAKPDQLSKIHVSASDVKTCQDATKAGFRRALWAYGYHYQEAMYRRAARSLGLELGDRDFAFVLCETSAPYHWNVLHCSVEDVWEADRAISRDLLRLRACLDSGEWPGLIGTEPDVVSMRRERE